MTRKSLPPLNSTRPLPRATLLLLVLWLAAEAIPHRDPNSDIQQSTTVTRQSTGRTGRGTNGSFRGEEHVAGWRTLKIAHISTDTPVDRYSAQLHGHSRISTEWDRQKLSNATSLELLYSVAAERTSYRRVRGTYSRIAYPPVSLSSTVQVL